MMMRLEDWRRRGRWFEHRGHAIFYMDEQRDPARDTVPERSEVGAGAGRPGASRTRLLSQGAVSAPGHALLLIHGFPTASWDYSELWPLIAPRFGRLIAPDMIGFGFSAKPREYSYDLMDQADLHEHLLAHWGVREVHVLAHDYGVSVAQELLARHMERKDPALALRSVTLLNGGLFPETHRPRLVQKLLLGPAGPLVSRLTNEARFSKSLAAVFGPRTQPTPEQAQAFWQLMAENGGNRIAHRLIRYILDRRRHRERWVEALQHTRVPLRLINGPEDPVSGAHMVRRYRQLVPHPDVVSLPGIGHYPQVEAPQALADAFLAFVASVDRVS